MTPWTLVDTGKLLVRHRGTVGVACGIAVALSFGSAYGAVVAPARSPAAGSISTMKSFDASHYPINTSMTQYRFISAVSLVSFVDNKTAADVTGTINFGSSNNQTFSFEFAVCYQSQAGGALTSIGSVHPKVHGPAYFVAQTVTGVIRGLSPGQYQVGLCAFEETPNTVQAEGVGTLIVAEP